MKKTYAFEKEIETTLRGRKLTLRADFSNPTSADEGYSDLFGYVNVGSSLESCDITNIEIFSERRNKYVPAPKKLEDVLIEKIWDENYESIEKDFSECGL